VANKGSTFQKKLNSYSVLERVPMNFVYVLIESEVNPVAFANFADAKASVLERYREELDIEKAQGYPMASDVDVEESATGVTYLYIEKGIHIYIHKLCIR